MSSLEEIASRVKRDHNSSNSNIIGTGETMDDKNTISNSSTEIEDGKQITEHAESSVTNGGGLAGTMNQMLLNENESEEKETESDVEESPNNKEEEDDDTAIIIPESPSVQTEKTKDEIPFEITDEEIKAYMPDIPDEEAIKLYENIRRRVMEYRKDQVYIKRMTLDKATEKAKQYMKDIADEENIRYLKDNPNLLIVQVDKTKEKDIDFTKDEKEKIVKTKVIKLEVIETDKLPIAKIRKVDKKKKIALIQNMDTHMAQYSVPLPIMCDYVMFKGAQLVEINNLQINENTTALEVTEKKANLIYRQLIGGANLRKFGDDGKAILSYADFLNTFPMFDMDMAVYGIMVASSMENMETDLFCDECGERFTAKYNMKRLMTMDGLSDDFKGRFNDILTNSANALFLNNLYTEHNKTHVITSPLTHNIYEIDTPSIGRTIEIYQRINMDSEIDVYYSIIYQHVKKIWIYDSTLDDYVTASYDENEYHEVFTGIRNLPQTELDILQQFISPMIYKPIFRINARCEHCGFIMKNELSPNDMVFLSTRNTPTEIRMS